MPQVQVIQPIQQQPKRLRVAAYARVSSKSTNQLNSMSVQVEYYTDLIQKNSNWEFVGVYADEGISGTGLKNRAGFNHLMDDCRLGLIDRILVKSSSRMARNSVDFLSAVRELKSLGVVVEFEKERFDTDSTEGELLLGMMCAVAQEESLSISKNLRWGILHDLQGGTTELEKLQQKLADSQQEFDRLLDLSLECDASFLDEKLKHASEEIDNLQKQINQLTASRQKATNPNLQLTDSDFRITEYSDTLVARIIERIEVISAVRIKIEFIGGYTVTVPLQS